MLFIAYRDKPGNSSFFIPLKNENVYKLFAILFKSMNFQVRRFELIGLEILSNFVGKPEI